MKPRIPIYLKITLASLTVTLSVLAFVAQAEYRSQSLALEDKFGLTLQHIAQTIAPFLDGDAHERVRSNQDTKDEDFRKLREIIERVRRENALKEENIYTLRKVAEGEMEFVIMLQERTFVGSRYRPPPVTRPIIEWVLSDGTPRYTPIYKDDHGSWVSGYAPIRDSKGRIVALLEVDYSVDTYLAQLKIEMSRKAWLVPASVVLALVLSLLMARSISRSVARLVDGTSAVRRGEYEHRVVVNTRDELRTLAEAFNDMLVGLRERFAMLKFVPRHTRALIAEVVRDRGALPDGSIARRREVAVFFSDIRGFTALSDTISAEKVVQMLNIYLRMEAEVLERHGGAVDKFIGDAVMAIFEGDDRFERAVEAAIEIQRRISALNEQHAFERSIDVGIGIAGGQVVMGNIGYEDRLEYAVIGRVVNLASRLTSVAGKGEIVVSDVAWHYLIGKYQAQRVEGLRLKGFADEVTCYRISSAPPAHAEAPVSAP